MSEVSARRTHTQRSPYIGLAVVLTVVSAIGVAQFGWWRYITIAGHHSTAMGTVLRTECGNRNNVSYSFPANGSDVAGKDSWMGCRSLRPGDKIPVAFSSLDPTQNIAGNGYARLAMETISILVASAAASLWIAFTFLRRK
jgi:hypothetical protein